jgi:methylglutamate dehydrogenase subunit D
VGDLSAFADCTPVTSAHEGAHATPVEPLAVVSITTWDTGAAIAAILATFGVELPEAGRWAASEHLVAVWLAPNHWSLQRAGAAPLLPDVVRAVGAGAAVIDLTNARATLRLSGPASHDILAALVPIDLHPRAFAPGRAASTVAGHLTVQLRQLDIGPSYEISVGRSFAGSLWRALELAGAGRLGLG